MNCQDMLKAIGAYLDGEAAHALCRELEKHLSDCNPCRLVVDTLRKTITIYKSGKPLSIPVPCRRRLHALLREHWAIRFG
jgi:predicted anti-sigma-YlaC factor YlaD